MSASAPAGFVYRPALVSGDEEAALVEAIRRLEFSPVEMRGQVARRRVVHFGWRYGYTTGKIEPGPELPEFLAALRARAAALAEATVEDLAEALITEYPPGAGIGWHRDAPAFGVVVAVSLLTPCRLQLRRAPKTPLATFALAPRSAYVLTGTARWQWQHRIPPVAGIRYSVTFRTLRTEPVGLSRSAAASPGRSERWGVWGAISGPPMC